MSKGIHPINIRGKNLFLLHHHSTVSEELTTLRTRIVELEERLAILAEMRKSDEVFIDATPEGYPVRILQHYRDRCNERIEAHPPSPVYDIMNEHQVERAEVLDNALAKLREGRVTWIASSL